MICGNQRKVESGLKFKCRDHLIGQNINTHTLRPWQTYQHHITTPFILQHHNTWNKHIWQDDILHRGSESWHATLLHTCHSSLYARWLIRLYCENWCNVSSSWQKWLVAAYIIWTFWHTLSGKCSRPLQLWIRSSSLMLELILSLFLFFRCYFMHS